jgi:hypothetical protein
MYYNNDYDSPIRVERGDLAAVTAGISAPASAPTFTSYSSVSYSPVGVTLSAVSVDALSGVIFPQTLVGRTISISGLYSKVVSTVSVNGGSLNVTSAWTTTTNTASYFIDAYTASGSTAGAHTVRYRYYDAKTGYISNPSPSFTATTLAYANNVIVTASNDAKVTNIILEATTVGGSVFYENSKIANATASASLTLTDTQLENSIDINAVYGDFGHELPPIVEIMCEHRGRMFGWKRSVRTRTSCTVASGSLSITGTNFPTNSAWTGRLLTVNAETTSNVIASTTSTNITLASVYAGSASGAANTIKVFHPQPDMLYWSRAGFPESWKPSTWARRVLQGGSDEPSAMFSAYDTLWLCGQHSIRCFDYTADPAAARLSSVPTDMGVYNQKCIVQADGRTFGFGTAGVFELQGRVPTRISDDIEPQLQALIDNTQFDDFHGCYDNYEKSITWYFTRTGDTVPKDGISYSLDSGQWQFVSYLQSIKCSTTYGTGVYSYRPYLADSNSWVWRVGDDRPADCLPSALSTGVLTTASANSTTVINIVESLPTGSGDCRGAMLYWPATGESRVISSNTANTVTVGTAFTTAPGTGVTLYLGSISVYLKSDHWIMRNAQHFKRPPYLGVQHFSESTGPEIYFSIYTDLSSSVTPWTSGSADVLPYGVTNTSSTVRTVDTNQTAGIAYVPMPDKWASYWRWTMTSDKPYGLLQLMDVQFILTDASQVDTNIKPT